MRTRFAFDDNFQLMISNCVRFNLVSAIIYIVEAESTSVLKLASPKQRRRGQ
jgi:hypothetical protein